MNMKKVYSMLAWIGTAAALFSCSGKAQQEAENETFRYLIDEFADLKVMRYRVPGWESLGSLTHLFSIFFDRRPSRVFFCQILFLYL